MVSIVIPIYNAEKKLERCVDSILSQSYSDFELILINDGSRDGSSLICERLAKKDVRIRYFSKENSGASDTRNFGIKKARGKYITFTDADDWVEPYWLSTMVESITDVDLVIQGFVKHEKDRIQEESIKEAIVQENNYSMACAELLKTAHMGYLWSMLFKTDIIKKNNILLYTKMSFHEDLDFILRYLLHTRSFKTIKSCGYHYYQEYKHYCHNVSGCYSIVLTLSKLLKGEELERYRRRYRTEAYNSLVFHDISDYEILRAKCFLTRFGRPCNGIKANVISNVLAIPNVYIIRYIAKIIGRLIK